MRCPAVDSKKSGRHDDRHDLARLPNFSINGSDTPMNDDNILDSNRVILCHFDSYSTALVFARYGSSVLAPAPLPETARAMPVPEDASERHAPGAVLNALAAQYVLDLTQLRLDDDFQAWMSSERGPIRIHLARYTISMHRTRQSNRSAAYSSPSVNCGEFP